jgi:2-iminobutanoate/2-iminopropanoate deaminase
VRRRIGAVLVGLAALLVGAAGGDGSLAAFNGLLEGQGRRVVPGSIPGVPYSAAVQADGLIYVGGNVSEEGGDIRAQTRVALESLDRTLKQAGSSLANVASVQVYLADAADYAGMNEVYRTFWPTDPPVRTTVAAGLTVPESRIEITAVAIPDGGERRVIHPAGWVRSPNPYSYGIQSGDTLFLSGLVARNGRDNSIVDGDMTAQTKVVLDNAREILEAAGMSLADVVSSRVYIADGAAFQDMNAAYQTYFPSAPPARATVVAGLTGPQYKIEIALTAVRGDKRAITTPAADGTPGRPSRLLSSAIAVGNRLYVSGMLGSTAATKGDAAAQTTESLARIGRTLTAAGFDWADVVDGIIYLPDLAHYDAMNGAYRTVFTKTPPARATVRPGLVSPDGLVEIMFVAVK